MLRIKYDQEITPKPSTIAFENIVWEGDQVTGFKLVFYDKFYDAVTNEPLPATPTKELSVSMVDLAEIKGVDFVTNRIVDFAEIHDLIFPQE